MPKIRWTDLPPALRDHLLDRLRERKITAQDLYRLKLWRESDPDAPDGEWYKDFGSFKVCGDGEYPKTFLLRAKLRKVRSSDARAFGGSLLRRCDRVARGATRSKVFEEALEGWLRNVRQRSLEDEVERYYSSLSKAERAEDSKWAGLAPRALGETWT